MVLNKEILLDTLIACKQARIQAMQTSTNPDAYEHALPIEQAELNILKAQLKDQTK